MRPLSTYVHLNALILIGNVPMYLNEVFFLFNFFFTNYFLPDPKTKEKGRKKQWQL